VNLLGEGALDTLSALQNKNQSEMDIWTRITVLAGSKLSFVVSACRLQDFMTSTGIVAHRGMLATIRFRVFCLPTCCLGI
jgi:hypothetical protein